MLQLGITKGSYDSDAEDVITTDKIFMLNAYGKSKDGNATNLATNYFLSIAILADAKLNAANFGSFMFGANTYTINDMVFGTPPDVANKGKQDGDIGSHGIYDTWFLQYPFHFSDSKRTANVNVQKTPGFDPLANPGKDYFFNSFSVNTTGLFANYNLHFDLFSTVVSKKGETKVSSHAPFSHDASTAFTAASYDQKTSEIASVPEPSTSAIFAMALAGLCFSRKFVRPPVAQKIDDDADLLSVL